MSVIQLSLRAFHADCKFERTMRLSIAKEIGLEIVIESLRMK